MLKSFVICLLLAASPITFASDDIPINCDVAIEKAKSALSEQGFQNFVEKCTPKSTVENVGAVSVDIINAAGDNTKGIIEATATSLSKAARELGITINEFISTPAGMLVVVVAVMSFVPKWVITLPVIMVIIYIALSRMHMIMFSFKYEYTPYFFGLLTRKKIVERTKNDDAASEIFLTFAVCALAILGLTIIMG